MPEARDGCQEEQPHLQGVVAARAQEGLEEIFHVKVRGAAVRKYPSSKVRETQVRWQALREGIREQTH